MQHVAIDLETLSTRPNGVILTVGLCFFDDTHDLLEAASFPLAMQEQQALGRVIDPSTLGWWMRQSDAARQSISYSFGHYAYTLGERLMQITRRFEDFAPERVWGNGSDFDNAMLASLFTDMGLTPPWSFWRNRDMRTLMDAFPEYERIQPQVAHSAQDDAVAQALTIRRILSKGQF